MARLSALSGFCQYGILNEEGPGVPRLLKNKGAVAGSHGAKAVVKSRGERQNIGSGWVSGGTDAGNFRTELGARQ